MSHKVNYDKKYMMDRMDINPSNWCWEWNKHICKLWYWQLLVTDEHKQYKAHRYSYILHKWDIPEWLLVCHTCDNRKCINPDHLFLWTQMDNMQDMKVKWRFADTKWDKNWRCRLTKDVILEVRRIANEGTLSRKEIWEMFWITDKYVSKIKSKVVWKHI